MRLRVVRCPEDAHDLPWVDADECEHWPRKCPRAKKAKKASHKLKGQVEPGYLVAVTGIPPEGWPYDYDPPDLALETSTKRYAGHWARDPGNYLTDAVGQGGVWVPARRGNLIHCANCDLLGAS